MKNKLLSLVVYFLYTGSSLSQGTVILSNIGLASVTWFGAPAEPGVCISLALPDGSLVGSKTKVLGAGFFSGGVVTLKGLTSKVDLVLAVWREGDENVFLSDMFTVDIGDGGNPPAKIPASFSGMIQGWPHSPPQPQTNREWILINKWKTHYFFKAKDLKFIRREENRILIEYTDFSITSGPNILVQD